MILWENSRINNTYLVGRGFLCNIVIYSTIAYNDYSTIKVVNPHCRFRYELGGDHDILEIKFVFDASFACGHKSKGSPLSHHINMMWKHVCDRSRLRSNRSACNSTKYMDP